MLSTQAELERGLRQICDRQRKTFSVNVSLGILTRNIDTGLVDYRVPWNSADVNTDKLLVNDIYVRSDHGVETVLSILTLDRFFKHANKGRENSNNVLLHVCNVAVYVNHHFGIKLSKRPRDDSDDPRDESHDPPKKRKFKFKKSKLRLGGRREGDMSSIVKAEHLDDNLCVFFGVAWAQKYAKEGKKPNLYKN